MISFNKIGPNYCVNGSFSFVVIKLIVSSVTILLALHFIRVKHGGHSNTIF